jgi:flagellar basal-body rod protein FlgC
VTGPRPLALLPAAGVELPRPRFRSLGISASGLSAQRARMETIAQNIANADVTRTAEGGPYRRKTTIIEAATAENSPAVARDIALQGTLPSPVPPFGGAAFEVPAGGDTPRTIPIPLPRPDDGLHGVVVTGTAEAPADAGRLVYEPGHPDADANGYVRYPDIDTTQELVHLLDAKRLYEANATVFQTTKSMLRAALDI